MFFPSLYTLACASAAYLCLYMNVSLYICGFFFIVIVIIILHVLCLLVVLCVCPFVSGLDAPLHQYPISEWHLSGLDLFKLTSIDLENLGVHKIGHQELILEAVERLCSLVRQDVSAAVCVQSSDELLF